MLSWQCGGFMNCLMHPWVLFLNCDVGLNVLSPDTPRNSSAEQTWPWLWALCWSCGCGAGQRWGRLAGSDTNCRGSGGVWTSQLALPLAPHGFHHHLKASAACKNPKEREWDGMSVVLGGRERGGHRLLWLAVMGKDEYNTFTAERCLGSSLQSFWNVMFWTDVLHCLL